MLTAVAESSTASCTADSPLIDAALPLEKMRALPAQGLADAGHGVLAWSAWPRVASAVVVIGPLWAMVAWALSHAAR